MTSLLEMEAEVDSCTELFTRRMSEVGDNGGKEVDLGAWLQHYAFDVIGELTFSKKFGFLERGEDVDKVEKMIDYFLIYTSRIGQIPVLHYFMFGHPLLKYMGKTLVAMNPMLQFTLRALQARQTLEKEQPELAKSSGKDMLSKWTAAKMDSRHIVTHTSVNVGAGSDSTAISLRAIIYFLLRNPEKLQKLIDQIDQADRDGKLSPLISYRESTTHLPYMEAVMKEATRLHPGVGLILEREVPKGGADIAGHHFRAGTIVGINAWVLGHDADVFPDPESFIPERWIDNTPDRLKEMEQSWFIFGAGARTCIGKNISLMEMAKLVPQLLREFTFELTYPEKEWTTTNVWFVIQRGLICNLTPRARKAVA